MAVRKRTEATGIKLHCLRRRFRYMQRIPGGGGRDRHNELLRSLQFRRYRGIGLNNAYRSLGKLPFHSDGGIAFHRDVSSLGRSPNVLPKIEPRHRDRPRAGF